VISFGESCYLPHVRLLVTGDQGFIGAWVARALVAAGHNVVGFDRKDGYDLLDATALMRAAAGCEATIHLAALPHDSAGTPDELLAVNVDGTTNVLTAAEAAGHTCVVQFSSAQVFGIGEGEQEPEYFPIDDHHPRNASRPYGQSKVAGEELCESFTARTGIDTISLRPVLVTPPGYPRRRRRTLRRLPEREANPYWEFGAWIDVRDVAAAALAALSCRASGHQRLVLCASDIAGTAPARELATRFAPTVPFRSIACFDADPYAALVDNGRARQVLGWEPKVRFHAPNRPRWLDHLPWG
jgi:nucleoside-diphosphate-sugar epimerase